MQVNKQAEKEPSLQEMRAYFKKNFRQNFEHCADYIANVHGKFLEDIILTEIRAACEFKRKHWNAAAQYYEFCINLDPMNKAFYNNLAMALVQKGEHKNAVDMLLQTSEIWKIPVIWSNLSKALEEGKLRNQDYQCDPVSELSIALNKYPLYRNYDKDGLIHSFELPEHVSTSEALQLQEKLITRLTSFNFLSEEERKKFLQESKEIIRDIQIRRRQEIQHGIFINKRDLTIIQLLETLIEQFQKNQAELLGNEVDQTDFYEAVKEKVQKFIDNHIQIANEVKQNQEWEQIENICIAPFRKRISLSFDEQRERIYLAKIEAKELSEKLEFQKMLELERKQQEEIQQQNQVKRLENKKAYQDATIDQLGTVKQVQNPRKSLPEYNFVARSEDLEVLIQKVQTNWLFCFEKGQLNPALKIISFTEKGVNGHSSYIEKSKFSQILKINKQVEQAIEKQYETQKAEFLKKFYWALTLLFKIYNMYSHLNYTFIKGHQGDEKLELDELLEMMYPLLEAMPLMEENFANVAYVIREIHIGISQYIKVCHSREENDRKKLFHKLLKKIDKATETDEECVNQLLREVSHQKSYADSLTNQQSLKIDSNTKQHQYFKWKVSKQHKIDRNLFDQHQLSSVQELLIENCVTFLVCLMEKQKFTDEGSMLIETLVDWSYEFVSKLSQRKIIIRNFYRNSHEISKSDRITEQLRKAIKKVLF